MITATIIGSILSHYWRKPPDNVDPGELLVLVAARKKVDGRRLTTKIGCLFKGQRSMVAKVQLAREGCETLLASGELYSKGHELYLCVSNFSFVVDRDLQPTSGD